MWGETMSGTEQAPSLMVVNQGLLICQSLPQHVTYLTYLISPQTYETDIVIIIIIYLYHQ